MRVTLGLHKWHGIICYNLQAISVSSEQIFSIAKHTISPIRNRLSEEIIRASLCLKTCMI
ncbi:hypothetical protein GLOIN_2v1446931 [Rhizophagus irregularis DAOM 181602=DAOM 197198]|uniref:HAT C-terminal dimerisation domain-containing protein n=1 Tax=Rhizophagus irregularis (strain DAOM 181602 / DAOM 197198 / MUCL 43194) TaxID=747089 RepID=U9TRM3_RHIID|nr:hypothetical protein GLOIN_2v1446931 [Rhizophagus irregularis DAOM 181602=DAOM 197198]POG82583.1 hypothetical protein GLOIN_2v1446931 [Rhizophagus irregularis DAOM 181602=DAOM 197198]GBC24198.1 hypothetical protein GLOIN_2v1446931 [Rhizophagus irregularis DAOM 181602=DAOM 197198]|eukprot:XP_025189449.1 hypothetical protein GLOIN_2v1446931 [Rhizophagus irregularis DAOM 181602=DAOM 197198]